MLGVLNPEADEEEDIPSSTFPLLFLMPTFCVDTFCGGVNMFSKPHVPGVACFGRIIAGPFISCCT